MKKGNIFCALLAVFVFVVAILFATRVIKMQIGVGESVNPGWGVKLGQLMASDAPTVDLDKTASRWTEGSFGRLVSLMQGNQNAPAIKNLV